MTKALHHVLNDIAEVRAGQLEWGDIPFRLFLQALDDEGIELERDEFDRLVQANPEFALGDDRYELVHTDNGEAGWECRGWSYILLRHDTDDNIVWASESHPY